MNENEAVEALLNELDGVEAELSEPVKEEEPTKAVKEEEPNKLDLILQSLQELKSSKEPEQAKIENTPTKVDQEALNEELNSLGLNNLQMQLNAQQEALNAQQEKINIASEQARLQSVFNANLEQLKKEFPTIDPDELGKFAMQKELFSFLGEDYKGWKLVASHMISLAKPTSTPDQITSSSGKTGEITAFDKLKKGENVSDIEFGAELLKSIM
ncbi:HIT family hydrolase [Campylobacter fetus]|uniref:HIT family hydrolase n=1 Tax=Campylobacter fetus TaxID=196 RepID=UPI00138E4A51|nr:HIT family hydrolase [Campylobacter fetus]